MIKLLTIDLQDDFKPDNEKFYNLLNLAKWTDLIDRVKDEEPLDELLEEMIEDAKQSI